MMQASVSGPVKRKHTACNCFPFPSSVRLIVDTASRLQYLTCTDLTTSAAPFELFYFPVDINVLHSRLTVLVTTSYILQFSCQTNRDTEVRHRSKQLYGLRDIGEIRCSELVRNATFQYL